MARWTAQLRRKSHRAFPPPQKPWLVRMAWHNLLFAHWALPVELVWRAVRTACAWRNDTPVAPPGLELDTRDGRAWVGVVAFHMTHVGLRVLPDLPPVASFPELNLRTYVRMRGGDPGVFFLSLDAASLPAVHIARTWFHLSYFWSRIKQSQRDSCVHYVMQRRHKSAPEAAFEAHYEPAAPPARPQVGTLEHWLTERYCLYAAQGARCWRGDVHHRPWPLQAARAGICTNTLGAPLGLTLVGPPDHLAYARRVDALAWAPAQVA